MCDEVMSEPELLPALLSSLSSKDEEAQVGGGGGRDEEVRLFVLWAHSGMRESVFHGLYMWGKRGGLVWFKLLNPKALGGVFWCFRVLCGLHGGLVWFSYYLFFCVWSVYAGTAWWWWWW